MQDNARRRELPICTHTYGSLSVAARFVSLRYRVTSFASNKTAIIPIVLINTFVLISNTISLEITSKKKLFRP